MKSDGQSVEFVAINDAISNAAERLKGNEQFKKYFDRDVKIEKIHGGLEDSDKNFVNAILDIVLSDLQNTKIIDSISLLSLEEIDSYNNKINYKKSTPVQRVDDYTKLDGNGYPMAEKWEDGTLASYDINYFVINAFIEHVRDIRLEKEVDKAVDAINIPKRDLETKKNHFSSANETLEKKRNSLIEAESTLQKTQKTPTATEEDVKKAKEAENEAKEAKKNAKEAVQKAEDGVQKAEDAVRQKKAALKKLAAQLSERPVVNIEALQKLINAGISLQYIAESLINKPDALKKILDDNKHNIPQAVSLTTLMQKAIDVNNSDSLKVLISAGAKITYDHLVGAIKVSAQTENSLGIITTLLQNGAPTTKQNANILDNLINHTQRDQITTLVSAHEALRNGFATVKNALMRKDNFRYMNPEELMDVVRTVMLKEDGPVRKYLSGVGAVNGVEATNDAGKKALINELSLTDWEEFKAWFVSAFTDKTQDQLRAEVITSKLDALFKKEIFDAVINEVIPTVSSDNLKAAETVNKRNSVLEGEDPRDDKVTDAKQSPKKSFVDMIKAERAARGNSHGQDVGGR
ncbi:MAG: hypothetical protein ACK5WS_06930 [Alphaproteobacteria bacterium]|nr:hypothetical protein [Candidatus Jidaibacter sp.]